mgnify:CR=1 FL=1
MIKLYDEGVFLSDGKIVEKSEMLAKNPSCSIEDASKKTMAYSIMSNHNTSGNNEKLKIRGLLKSLRSLESLGTLETLMGTIAAKPLLSHLSSLFFPL